MTDDGITKAMEVRKKIDWKEKRVGIGCGFLRPLKAGAREARLNRRHLGLGKLFPSLRSPIRIISSGSRPLNTTLARIQNRLVYIAKVVRHSILPLLSPIHLLRIEVRRRRRRRRRRKRRKR
jgi:hypothetical protein